MSERAIRQVCVVGGAGFIGGHFVDRLLASDATQRVTVYDNFSSGREWHLACKAFDAVAGDRGAEGARRDAQAQSRIGFMIGQDRQTKKGIGKLFAAPLHFTKFGRLVQTLARLELQLIDWWIGKQPGIQVTDRGACGPWRDGGRANLRPLFVAMRARKP